MTTLRRKENTAIEAVQYLADKPDMLDGFVPEDLVDIQHDGNGTLFAVRSHQQSMPFIDGDWICKDAEGYFYVLADILKKKIYDEVES